MTDETWAQSGPAVDDFKKADLIRHFTDREEFKDDFRRRLKQPADQTLPIMNYFGKGGNGKSWLMRYLMWKVCYEVGFDEKGRGYPCAYVSFRNLQTSPEPVSVFTNLRQQLGRNYGIKCPRFDLIWALNLELEEGRRVQDTPSSRLPEDLGILVDLLEILDKAPVLGAATRAYQLFERLNSRRKLLPGQNDFLNWFERNVGTVWRRELHEMNRNARWVLLGKAFAADLHDAANELRKKNHTALQKQHSGNVDLTVVDKIVLILDTYEQLFTVTHHLEHTLHDNWVQDFAKALVKNATPVILVISGRDRLRWNEIDPWWENQSSLGHGRARPLESKRVGDFEVKDVVNYLKTIGLPGPQLPQFVFDETRGNPLLMYMLVAAFKNANLKDLDMDEFDGKQWEQEWVPEFLNRLKEQWARSDLELFDVIRAATVPRLFSYELLLEMLPDKQNALYRLFDQLIAHDFVELQEEYIPQQDDDQERWYSLHPLVRIAFLNNMRKIDRRRFEQVARDYFVRQVATEKPGVNQIPFCLREQIYHEWYLDEKTGYQLFKQYFDPQLQTQNLSAMLQLLNALPAKIKDSELQLRILVCHADFYNSRKSKNDISEAERLYEQITQDPNAPTDLHIKVSINWGRLKSDSGDFSAAAILFQNAIDEARRSGASRELALGMQMLANLWALQGQLAEAIGYHEASLEYFSVLWEQAIQAVPPDEGTLRRARIDLSSIYNDLAVDYMERNQPGDVEQALSTLDAALKLSHEAMDIEGEAFVYTSIAEVHAQAQDYQRALSNLQLASNIVDKQGFRSLKISIFSVLDDITSAVEASGDIEMRSLLAELNLS